MRYEDLPKPGVRATFWLMGGHHQDGIVREYTHQRTAILIDPVGFSGQGGFAEQYIDVASIVSWFRYKERDES